MEFVFVVPREALFRGYYPQGFQPFRSPDELERLCACVRQEGFFVERARAEREPTWKQIIPYSLVSCEQRVLLMRRRRRGAEARLHDKLSIGVGGHIEPQDLETAEGLEGLVEAGARREIGEELELGGSYELSPVGFLNDDSNPVGAVHLGLVHVVTVTGSVRIREDDLLEGRLVELEELRELAARREGLETWSSILIAHIDELPNVPRMATSRIES